MAAIPTLFGDGVLDVHVANGVARITIGTVTGQTGQGADAKPQTNPSGLLIIPVVQLQTLARVLTEVTRQVEQRAKDAMAQARPAAASEPAAGAAPDQVAGAFRFNG